MVMRNPIMRGSWAPSSLSTNFTAALKLQRLAFRTVNDKLMIAAIHFLETNVHEKEIANAIHIDSTMAFQPEDAMATETGSGR